MLYFSRWYTIAEGLYLDESGPFAVTIDGLSESEELGVRRWWYTLMVTYMHNTELDILSM